MIYRVGIARRADEVEATVLDLVGCCATAPDTESLHKILPAVVGEYEAWLRRHGETLEERSPADFDIVEEIDPASIDAVDGEFCFDHDREAASDEWVETAIRYMGHSRRDLLKVTAGLPDAVLDWRPPKSAMAKIDPWNPFVLTIREIIAGVAGSEGYYRTGLEDGEPKQGDDGENDLSAQRDRVIERLRGLTDDERSRVFKPRRPWQDRPETWTARKVMRRIISHERFHTMEIQQRLGWLLLGVPHFERTRVAEEGATVNG